MIVIVVMIVVVIVVAVIATIDPALANNVVVAVGLFVRSEQVVITNGDP